MRPADDAPGQTGRPLLMRALRQWGPAVLWAGAIWFFSTAAFSSVNTSPFILPGLHWLFPRAAQETLEWMHFLVRKMGHFVEFFLFSLFVLRGIRGGRPGWKLRWALASLAIAAGYASFDEFHQAFVPGRTASPKDSLLDTGGAAAAQLLLWLRARWMSRSLGKTDSAGPRPA